MKSKLLITTILSTFVALQASAIVTMDGSTNMEYLENSGYSQATIEMVQAKKAQANGEKYISKKEIEHANDNIFVKGVRRFFIYFDPALDSDQFMNHDIKISPSINDL